MMPLTAALPLPSLYRTGLLVIAGLGLLAMGSLVSGWPPVEMPLGLVSLGAVAAILLGPCRWREGETLEALGDLSLASLVVFAGFHLLA